MFTTPTVFVLGAGISVPYNFPSGEQLLQILSGKIDASSANSFALQHEAMVTTLKSIATRPGDVDMFVSRLRKSLTPSIDTWLQEHPDYMDIGKLAIAFIIGSTEGSAMQHRYVADDWYQWLFHAMQKGCKRLSDLSANNVTFVSFNYDRMLEWKMEQAILNSYSCPDSEINEAIEIFFSKVIHVHGHLAFQPASPQRVNVPDISWGYLHNLQGQQPQTKEWALKYAMESKKLASHIRIIGEKDSSGMTAAIKERISSSINISEKIIFLGFGYDERNLALLPRIADHAAYLANKLSQLDSAISDLDYPVIGTAFHLGRARRHDVKGALQRIRLGSNELSCVTFCNDYISLR